MDLNQYPKEELQTLLIGIAVAKQYATKVDGVFIFNQLDKWAERINDAIKDVAFEETQLPLHEVRINHHKYEFKCEAEAKEFAKFWGVKY